MSEKIDCLKVSCWPRQWRQAKLRERVQRGQKGLEGSKGFRGVNALNESLLDKDAS